MEVLDFVGITTKTKNNHTDTYPSFKVVRSKDLMVRGNSFYGIWDESKQSWSVDEFEAIRLIDDCTFRWAEEHPDKAGELQFMVNADNCLIDKWNKYCQKQAINNYVPLDETLVFSNTPRTRDLYSSKSLPYPLEEGPHQCWDRIMTGLYDPDEIHKIEWCIGSIVSGDSKTLQKFLVFYGAAGAGKSTVLNIVQQLFEGYYGIFDAKALGSNNNSFALEAFRSNPLVAIQHDGDLSRIEDNTKLNSLVSHEEMTINEKFKSTYTARFKAFLMMGTNKPVKITEAKSGLIRRLIDVTPNGGRIPRDEYENVVSGIKFELSGIAWHCLQVYLADPSYYNTYVPTAMLGASNDFYNFISDNYFTFVDEDSITLSLAWDMYNQYIEDARILHPVTRRAFKEELKNYFKTYKERGMSNTNKRTRHVYSGFLKDKFTEFADAHEEVVVENKSWLDFDHSVSIFDSVAKDYKAQTATADGYPQYKWDNARLVLKQIDTTKLHYVKVPENHIVIDFDIPGPDGKKNYDLNFEAASKWPPTYAELSKSGAGIHLHYIYSGDASKLSRVYDEHIEVKVYTGNASLRRQLTKCNALEIATISSGLPIKESKKMVDKNIIKNEKMLRMMILRNLAKEYHSGTKPSIDFIAKLLNDAYEAKIPYDVTDLRPSIMSFAVNSTNQALNCIKIVNKMKFKSDEAGEFVSADDPRLVFFDVEVFPNLFLVNWKIQGEGQLVRRMINPKPSDIENLVKMSLVGFNNRRYDNHILYARMMGYTNEELYELSQRIVSGSPNALFAPAYNMSYTDVYDFASAGNKKSLKKWEIELGLKHHELGLPWDQPVPEDMWPKVAEYCDDDVLATEAVFNHLEADFSTRKILSAVAGKSVNDSTNALSTAIVFGNDKKPQGSFFYRHYDQPIDVSSIPPGVVEYLENETHILDKPFVAHDGTTSALPYFPGYKFEFGKSTYRGLEVGEGGYVEAEHGYHENVALLDVASMHPTSMISECAFGPKYTKRFKDIVDGRLYVKHKEFDKLPDILNGAFVPYAQDPYLPTALKTPINSAYGLTSAAFDNQFRNPNNKDNYIAKRGALFMIDLKYEVEARGFTVAHIKTDSIKIPNATPEIINFVMEFGKRYGYTFEHEATYAKMCLVNNAVYIAKYAEANDCNNLYGYIPGDNKKKGGEWTATGTQFAVPYVYKSMFTHEPFEVSDYSITKSVKTAIHMNYNESDESVDNLHFVGKVGAFIPVVPGAGGGLVLREAKDKEGNTKYDSVGGTKGYRWSVADVIHDDSKIDKRYFKALVDDAYEAINQYTDAEAFMA